MSNKLGIGTTEPFLRMSNRLTDGSYKLVYQQSYIQLEGAMLLLGLPCFASIAWNKPLAKESLPALIGAGVYYLGMTTFYLFSPYDLAWQLGTSIERTMLLVNGGIFIRSYFILNSIENNNSIIVNKS